MKPGGTNQEFQRAKAYCIGLVGNPELFQTTNATPVQKQTMWNAWGGCMQGEGWTYTRVDE